VSPARAAAVPMSDRTASAGDLPPLLEVRDVSMRFGGLMALDGISLSVPASSVIGLIGPNGAGKSTLFGVCSGILRPTRGSVYMDGTDVTRASSQVRARRGLGRTFQRPEIFYTMTVREHLELAYRARYQPRRVLSDMVMVPSRWRHNADEDARVDRLLDSLGLRSVEHRRAATLPLGMQRYLEVGRALAYGPRLLLLDEPSSGLDVAETEQLGEVLRTAVANEGVSLLLVEHDLSLVLGLSQHVFVLEFGSLIAQGTPAEIRRSPDVQAAYLGSESVPEEPRAGASPGPQAPGT